MVLNIRSLRRLAAKVDDCADKEQVSESVLTKVKNDLFKRNPWKQRRPQSDGTNRFNSNDIPEHDGNWQYRHDDIQRVDNLFNEMKPVL